MIFTTLAHRDRRVSHQPLSPAIPVLRALRGPLAIPTKTLAFLAFLASLAWGLGSSPAQSETLKVKGTVIKVTLKPEKNPILLGEPTYLTFSLHNPSSERLHVLVGGDYRNALGRPESFKVEVTHADGTKVAQPEAGPSFGGLMGPQVIPPKGVYRFRLFLPHWAILRSPGSYKISAQRLLQFLPDPSGRWDGGTKTIDHQAHVHTTLRILPADPKAMGLLLQAWGTQMLGPATSSADDATRFLAAVSDERVIPFFVALFQRTSYSAKITALRCLAKFPHDAAFQILKNGMEVTASSLQDATTPEVAAQIAANVRMTAAVSLTESPHPAAKAYLLTRRNDPYDGIRITILHVLGRMAPKDALPILQDMANDKVPLVRNEAKRYIELLSKSSQDTVPSKR